MGWEGKRKASLVAPAEPDVSRALHVGAGAGVRVPGGAAEPAEALAGSASAPLPAATGAAAALPAEKGSAKKPYTLCARIPYVPLIFCTGYFLPVRATSCRNLERAANTAGRGMNQFRIYHHKVHKPSGPKLQEAFLVLCIVQPWYNSGQRSFYAQSYCSCAYLVRFMQPVTA